MSAFRLSDGSEGCPPTETPPATYVNPFRRDTAGRLWITSCFQGFQYFGAARHDMGTVLMGAAAAPNNNPWPGPATAAAITAGTYRTVSVTNETECDLGLLVGIDGTGDITTLCTSYVQMHVAAFFNGVYHTSSSWTNPQITGLTGYVRQFGNISANMHDVGLENTGTPSLTLASGATGVITVRYYLAHAGTPNGVESINSAGSAVRVYGYILPS